MIMNFPCGVLPALSCRRPGFLGRRPLAQLDRSSSLTGLDPGVLPELLQVVNCWLTLASTPLELSDQML